MFNKGRFAPLHPNIQDSPYKDNDEELMIRINRIHEKYDLLQKLQSSKLTNVDKLQELKKINGLYHNVNKNNNDLWCEWEDPFLETECEDKKPQ